MVPGVFRYPFNNSRVSRGLPLSHKIRQQRTIRPLFIFGFPLTYYISISCLDNENGLLDRFATITTYDFLDLWPVRLNDFLFFYVRGRIDNERGTAFY